MLKIGIIGDIGSGKSFIAKQFQYPVFEADQEVLKIYKKNKNCFKKLKKKLPKHIKSFPIRKNEISAAIFKNKNNLKKIEKIVHPEVQKNMNKFIKKNRNKKILIFDIPLLLEKKNYKKKYILIFVEAKKKDIIKKLKKRKNYNKIMINKLRKSQLPLEIKKKRANFIIKNDFKKFSTGKRVRNLIKKILQNERSST